MRADPNLKSSVKQMQEGYQMTNTKPEAPLLSVDEALTICGERPSRTTAYEEIRKHNTFLGIRVLRSGRRVFIPKKPLIQILKGEQDDAS